MIKAGLKDIVHIFVGETQRVVRVMYQSKIVWDYIHSCFGSGKWINNYEWSNKDEWKN